MLTLAQREVVAELVECSPINLLACASVSSNYSFKYISVFYMLLNLVFGKVKSIISVMEISVGWFSWDLKIDKLNILLNT